MLKFELAGHTGAAAKRGRRAMIDNPGTKMSSRERALLQGLLRGLSLPQLAAVRGETPTQVRAELKRLLALLSTRRGPFAAAPGHPAPRP